MKRISILMITALVCASIGSGAAWAAEGDGPPIKVGVVLPLTGRQAEFGAIEQNSFLLGLEEINKTGGVNGRRIELLIEDDKSDPDVGRSVAEKLISRDKVVMLGGGYSSAVTYEICKVAQERKVPFLVNTGSADKITEQGWEYIFRLNPPVSEYSDGLNSFLREIVKPETVTILYEDGLFGRSGSKKFASQAERMGLEVLLNEGYAARADDFSRLLIKAKSANPDLVYMISYVEDATLLMRQAMELDFNPKLFVGGAAGFTLPEFAEKAGKAAEYVYSVTLWTPNVPYSGARRYAEKYTARYGSPPQYHGAEAYAAVHVMADALERALAITPDAVREALAETDMMTAFGPVKFISYGGKQRQNSLPTYVVQWQNGRLETVWPKKMATQPFVYPVPPRHRRK